MAVNLAEPGAISPVTGVKLATGRAAIKVGADGTPAAGDRDDLTLLCFEQGTTVAGVYTQSSFRAAPVVLAETNIAAGGVRALLINSGNANAATGKPGFADSLKLCAETGAVLGLAPEAVAPFSTGVIGERLPVDRMVAAIRELPGRLSEANWLTAAKAIMTTDTIPKVCSTTAVVGGKAIVITGMTKGSGMIRPDMATMLAFICCDAAVERNCLQALLTAAANGSFNRISVDGDTSTNDALILAATGAAGNAQIADPQSADAKALLTGLQEVCVELAQAIVRDGEGATKFVTVRVTGGGDADECLRVAYTVADSPLVKTALFASDPNWGRLAMAIGRAGIRDLDVAGVDVWFDEVQVMAGGVKAGQYTEEAGAGVLAGSEFTIRIDLGRGAAEESVWTSDLSYDYVRINAEYRT